MSSWRHRCEGLAAGQGQGGRDTARMAHPAWISAPGPTGTMPTPAPSQPPENASLHKQLQVQLEIEVFRCWHQPALKDLHHPLLNAGRGTELWEWE